MAQLWGSWNLWCLYRVQRKKLAAQEGALSDHESGSDLAAQEPAKTEEQDKNARVTTVAV